MRLRFAKLSFTQLARVSPSAYDTLAQLHMSRERYTPYFFS